MGEIDFSAVKTFFMVVGSAAEVTFMISFLLIWSWTMRRVRKPNLKEHTVTCWRSLMISITIMTGMNIGTLIQACGSDDKSAVASAIGSMAFRLLADAITIWATLINNTRPINTIGDGDSRDAK